MGWYLRIEKFGKLKENTKYKTIKDAVNHHLNYITKKSREDLLFADVDKERIFHIVEREQAKRKDAVVLYKMIVALPNNIKNNTKKIKGFISDLMKKLDTEYYNYAVHLSKNGENENLHCHIVFSPRKSSGKKIELKKKDLYEIQKYYDELILKYSKKKFEKKQLKSPYQNQKQTQKKQIERDKERERYDYWINRL